MNKNNIISLTVMTLLATAVQAVSAEQQPGTGFIEGSQLSVLNRNCPSSEHLAQIAA